MSASDHCAPVEFGRGRIALSWRRRVRYYGAWVLGMNRDQLGRR